MIMNSQTVEIYGSINSEDEKLSYASLSILDSNIGTIADENGNFKLKVNLSKHIFQKKFIWMTPKLICKI